MSADQFINFALELVGHHLSVLKFFIGICTAIGGWLIVNGLPEPRGQRALFAALFVVSAGALSFGSWALLQRASAAVEIARIQLGAGMVSKHEIEYLGIFLKPYTPIVTFIGMWTAIILITVLIMTIRTKDAAARPEN